MEFWKKYRRSLFWIFGIPLLALAIFQFTAWHENSDWLSAVRADFPRSLPTELAARSLPALCANPSTRASVAGFCRSLDRLWWLSALAIGTMALTFLVLAASRFAGQRCRKDRMLLLKVFRVGSYGISVFCLFFVIASAALTMAGLVYLFGFLGRVPGGWLLLIGLGALVALYSIVRVLINFNQVGATDSDGNTLSDQEAPELWQFVSRTAAEIGATPPNQIIAGNDYTFFVTEMPVSLDSGQVHGRTLYLSLPLCNILTKPELRAVVAHEMAHFHGGDTEFSRHFFPVYRGSCRALEGVVSAAQGAGGGGYALLPVISLLSFYIDCFGEAEAEVSRDRELAADAAAAKVAGAGELATALMKLEIHLPAWEKVIEESVESDKPSHELPLPSVRFRQLASANLAGADRSALINSLHSQQVPHPTDSHPPTSVRIEALGCDANELFAAASAVELESPASLLIPSAEKMECSAMPDIVPRSDEVQRIFRHRQPGFLAISGMWNRTYLVFVEQDGLHVTRLTGMVDGSNPTYFEPLEELLDDPFFRPGTPAFEEFRESIKDKYVLPLSDISSLEFDPTAKWGLGKIPHAGKLNIRLSNGKKRQFILLGHAYGEGIARYIRERQTGA